MPTAIALFAAATVVVLWYAIRVDHDRRVANVAEATSYATRSELARRLIIQFQSLQGLAELWVSSSRDTGPAAGAKTPLALIRFEGIDAIAWSDSDGARFLATAEHPVLGYVPSADEWTPIQNLITGAHAPPAEATLGPFPDTDGHSIFHYYFPIERATRRGVLVAVIDAQDLLATLLVDEAPGYEISVSCCEGTELYRRGAADTGLSAEWTRQGRISPAPGILWNVAHRPSRALAWDRDVLVIDFVLIVGLATALLLGGLVFENRRARERAGAASEAEQRVRRLNRELEERVIARTQELNSAITDLNTINLSVSHDLRSRLNAISLITGQLQQAAAEDARNPARCEKIAENVERMVGITERLLGYSRTTSFDSELEEVDMRALAEEVVKQQSGAAHAVSIGALPPARADRAIVNILLGNLVGNALKHAQSARELVIEIGSIQLEDGTTAYFVRDNGPGLAKDAADRLFKPMTKTEGARHDGLGLGLAIAARAVERHGGKIWVESEPGQGATFLFTLRALGTNAAD
ncbi:MAG TPA: HAMP domain-containing sensor histidine kinase [Gammaproteobacteria bacterium]|jgi:signal transduction histidine kinase